MIDTAAKSRIPEEKLAEYWYEIRHQLFEELREVFRKSGLRQDTIASRLGRDKALVSRWLTGQENLTLRTMSNIARSMNCRLNVGVQPLSQLALANYRFDAAHGISWPTPSGTEDSDIDIDSLPNLVVTGSSARLSHVNV